MNNEGVIYLGEITTISGAKGENKITHTPLIATAQEISEKESLFKDKYKKLINQKISDPKGRELMLKVLYACLPQMARHQLFLKKKEEYHKKKEEEEWNKFKQWEKEREEKCYVRFLREFKLTEEKLKKRIGEENFNSLKSYKNNNFFTHLYYESAFIVGTGAKEDPIKLNSLAGEELEISMRPELLYGILSKFFEKMTEIKIKSFIYKYNLNPNDWEDIKQEVLIRFEKAKKMFNPEKAEMWTYLSRVADNSIINFTKKNVRRDVELNEEIVEDKCDIEENIDKDINSDCLISALEKLNQEEKDVIKLMYFDGLSQTDIAKKINKSQSTISRIIEKATQHLKEDDVLKRLYRE